MIKFLIGDCRETLKTLPDKSVQCVVTSPPYFGLRDYGTGTWEGGSVECDHVVGQMRRGLGLADSTASTRGGAIKVATTPDILAKSECPKCGAVRRDLQVGLEPTPEQFVAELVTVFREVQRVLRDDGTLWLNIGDSYAGSRCGPQGDTGQMADRSISGIRVMRDAMGNHCARNGAKPKDLIGIPWMLAFALREDGWYLRQDIIWHKPNPMPESTRDRCTKAHEYLFLLTKRPTYYFDHAAMKEEGVTPAGTKGAKGSAERFNTPGVNSRPPEYKVYDGKRNRRSVWTVATRPFKGAHFATFPPALIEPCILAGSRPGDTVLDPFGGAGTTGMVAQQHGRKAILCELNEDYVDIARWRLDVMPFDRALALLSRAVGAAVDARS